MKKKYILAVLAACTIFATGCGAKTETPQNTAQTEADGSTDSSDNTKSGDKAQSDTEQTVTGTIDEIKDFMFIVTDDSGNSYEFSFETKPDGLDNIQAGDRVKVTYTGELSEVDAFTGKIISVEKQ